MSELTCKGMAYIAGPYSAPTIYGVVKHIHAAEEVAVRWWNHGYAVICPHKNTALLDGLLEYEQFMAGDFEFIRRSDIVVMMRGWEKSPGATREHALAQQLGKKIVYE
jgi:hypothetical protein